MKIRNSTVVAATAAALALSMAAPAAMAAPTGAATGAGGTGAATGGGTAAAPVYVAPPAPAASPAPQPVYQAVPQVQAAAQPLQREPVTVIVDNRPIVIQETTLQETSPGLLVMNPEVQRQIGPTQVFNAASENYWQRDQQQRDHLNLTAAAGGTGAVLGAVGGAVAGGVLGGVAGAGAGFAIGTPLTIIAPAFGPLAPIVVTGPLAGAAVGAVAGGAAGAVAGAGAGAAGGFVGGASLVPGGINEAQEFTADTVWTLEDQARVNNGYKPLVGDKPSGLEGNVPVDPDAADHTDGTVTGQGANVAEQPSTQAVTAAEAAPKPAPAPAPVLPQPYQGVYDFVENAQNAANDFGTTVGNATNAAVDNAQSALADFALNV